MARVVAEIITSLGKQRIEVKSPWTPGGVDKAKSIPGGSWAKTRGTWSYQLSLNTCRLLRAAYGDDLVVGPALATWARTARRREKTLHRLNKARDAQLMSVPHILPVAAEAMASRRYQKSGARFIARSRNVLVADQPSLGKTLTAIAGIVEAGMWSGSHLVVAPKTALSATWERQFLQWTDVKPFVFPEGRPKREKLMKEFLECEDQTKVLIVNHDALRMKIERWCRKCKDFVVNLGDGTKEEAEHIYSGHKDEPRVFHQEYAGIVDTEWSSIILDESHDVLTTARPGHRSQKAEGLFRLCVVEDGLKIALTGTPLRGREQRLWGTGEWLGAMTGGYWTWVDSYFEIVEEHFGKSIGGIREDRKKAFYADIDTWILRRLKSEVRDDLPPVIPPFDLWVEPLPSQRKIYEDFRVSGEVQVNGGLMYGQGLLSELTRMKQMAYGEMKMVNGKAVFTGRSPKADLILQFLHDRGVTGKASEDWRPTTGGHKYVIASQFTSALNSLEEVLNKKGIQTAKVTGEVSGRARTEQIRAFDDDADGPRVMLLNTAAGGVSIDLDTYCDEMLIMDETFIDDDQVQLKARIDNRKGEVRPRMYYYIRTLGTIEEAIAKSNVDQSNLSSDLLDRRRGAEVALRILGGLQ